MGRPLVWTEQWRATLIIALMATWAFAAFAIPTYVFRDRAGAVPPVVFAQLRNEAARAYTIPTGSMQVTDARASGPYPYHVEGTVVYRSLFGLPVGNTRNHGDMVWYGIERQHVAGVWAVLLN